ncbi:MAG: hypothetical protein Q4B70_18115, partial [Lachnospiraceae bacterium]|nr:hypothetical protein [Lachnospiraceae bacterium]
MLHILLVVLKFIGILLLSLLGLVLFLVLVVLFAPIGYQAQANAQKEHLFFQGKGSWCFAIIRCKVSYIDNRLDWYIRLFGILVASSDEEFQKKKAEKAKRKIERKAAKEQRTKNKEQSESTKEKSLPKPEAVENPKMIENQKTVENPK